MIYEVKNATSLTDYFVICTADSQPQLNAIIKEIELELGEKGVHPLGIEGDKLSHWFLLDYGDFIIHLFRKESRLFYNLDGLWGDSPRIEFEEPAVKTRVARSI